MGINSCLIYFSVLSAATKTTATIAAEEKESYDNDPDAVIIEKIANAVHNLPPIMIVEEPVPQYHFMSDMKL